QVGDPTAEIKKVMVALDPCPVSVEEAIHHSCQLLVTHHPLIFKPLKRISTADEAGKLIHRSIGNNLAIASLHTNYDIAENGVNDLLAGRLGLQGCRPLKVTARSELLKLVVFVPLTHQDELMNALLPYSGMPGNYADCSFRVSGFGTFKPLDGAQPFLGSVGKRETVEECRLEIMLRRSELQSALKALRGAHPYEEPAFDLIPLHNEGGVLGIGRIGELSLPATFGDFADLVKERLGISFLRLVGEKGKRVSRVAVCGGSGASLLRDAARQGADVYVTGDIKYHEAREAESQGIAVIDAGHFATEKLMIEGLAAQLGEELARRRLEVTVMPCTSENDPFLVI
ncbi:MAG TPA: Nif3-like dinuclear metal center hexameric protein, partial [Geobacteraceae bacterium]|nr:Nif3-like dinuclear metal center hexameric protein [Geobacteraceae bacterium]